MSPTTPGHESGKIMPADIACGGGLHVGKLSPANGTGIVPCTAIEERVAFPAVPDAVGIFLFTHIITGVEIRWYPAGRPYGNVRRQMPAQGTGDVVKRNRGDKVVAPLPGNGGAEAFRVNPAVGAATSDNITRKSEQCRGGRVERGLNRRPVGLYLIAAILCADIANGN